MTTNTSNTLKESIADVQLLKKMAIESAKQAALDVVSELIQEELDDILMGKNNNEEEAPASPPLSGQDQQPPQPDLPIDPVASSDPAPTPPPPVPDAPGSDLAAPVQPSGPVNVPIPGPDGKIVLDLMDIFAGLSPDAQPMVSGEPSPTAPEMPAGGAGVPPELPGMGGAEPPLPPSGDADIPPLPPPPQDGEEPEQPLTPDEFKESVAQFHVGLKLAYLNETLTLSTAESFMSDLVMLYEAYNEVKEKLDNPELLESRLEQYCQALEEFSTTYRLDKGNIDMGIRKDQLNQFTKQLFREESSAGFGDSTEQPKSKPLDSELKNSMDGESGKKASKAAQDRSGDKRGSGDKKSKVKDPGKEESHEIKEINEAIDALFAEASAGTEEHKDSTVKHVPQDSAEPLREEDEEESDGEPMGEEVQVQKEAIQRRIKKINEEKKKLVKALNECGMGAPGTPVVNVNINIPGLSKDDIDVDTSEMGGGEELPEEEEDYSFMDEGDPEPEEEMMGGEVPPSTSDEEEEEITVIDDGEDSEGEVAPEEGEEEEEEEEIPVKESRVVRENKQLRAQLNEMEHLTARALYVSKLFADYGNLSHETKKKLVKRLDETQTVSEAKAVYHKLNKLLETKLGKKSVVTESARKPRVVTSGGSGRSGMNEEETKKVLSESKETEYSAIVSRFQKLSGIRK